MSRRLAVWPALSTKCSHLTIHSKFGHRPIKTCSVLCWSEPRVTDVSAETGFCWDFLRRRRRLTWDFDVPTSNFVRTLSCLRQLFGRCCCPNPVRTLLPGCRATVVRRVTLSVLSTCRAVDCRRRRWLRCRVDKILSLPIQGVSVFISE